LIASIGLPHGVFALGSGNLLLTPSTRACPSQSPRGPEFESPAGGGWRILFALDREGKVLYILTVDTRGQVYKHS